MTTFWTPEEIDYLRTARTAGLSRGEIAKALGNRSSNSVAGMINRLNIPFTPKPRTIEASSMPRKNNPPKPRSRTPRTIPVAPQVLKSIPDKAPDARNLTLIDLTWFQCHYPHGDGVPRFFFCGADTSSYPYCDFHRKLAYRKPW